MDQELVEAAKKGDTARLAALLDEHPGHIGVRIPPYDGTLLHAAAEHSDAVALLLDRGLDPNARERGDNTYAMHWAAAAGKLDVVKLLADRGGDVIGAGDDHALEVIGWATCWYGCDDSEHRAVADFLLSRGAQHHIFSAIAMNLDDEVRRIVGRDPSSLSRRMSRNENNQLPLHFAVRMNRPRMLGLLIELGADPLGVDASGMAAPAYAMTPAVDRPVVQAIYKITNAEMLSAERGHRAPNLQLLDLVAALAVGDFENAATIVRSISADAGALHMMAKRGDVTAVRWLLDEGANPNTTWSHWGADVTPLHLAALAGHADVARMLLDRGADPRIRDSMHDSDAFGWADYFGRNEIVSLLSPPAPA